MGDLLAGGSKKDASTKSTATQTTTTNNIDRRQVVAEGAMGIAADGATVNIQALDAGIVNRALDAVSAADATAGQGFNNLLALADRLFEGGASVLDKTASTTLAQVAALNTASNDATGSIDQKTLVILGGVALGAAYFLGRR